MLLPGYPVNAPHPSRIPASARNARDCHWRTSASNASILSFLLIIRISTVVFAEFLRLYAAANRRGVQERGSRFIL